MIDKLFELLLAEPLVSIISLALIVGLLVWVLQEPLRLYFIKKYDLVEKQKAVEALVEVLYKPESMFKTTSELVNRDEIITEFKNKL